MTQGISNVCRRRDCANPIPPSLALEQTCLDHFLDEAFERTNVALELSSARKRVEPKVLEHVLLDGLSVIENLEASAEEDNASQRDRMLELLFVMAHLHETIARQRPQAIPRFS